MARPSPVTFSETKGVGAGAADGGTGSTDPPGMACADAAAGSADAPEVATTDGSACPGARSRQAATAARAATSAAASGFIDVHVPPVAPFDERAGRRQV